MRSLDLELGGKTRQIKLTYNAICLAERVLREPILFNPEKWVSARFITAVVWAGLHHAGGIKGWIMSDAEIFSAMPTLDDVGEWIMAAEPLKILPKVLEAWTEALPGVAELTTEKRSGAGPLPAG